MNVSFKSTSYRGLLLIGDPHLEGRVPGFRKDDYPRTILNKLRWCLDYAARERLLPCILGDLFHLPRDNPNWLLVQLIQMLDQEIVAIYGNHDVHENQINEHDSMSVVSQVGRFRLLQDDNLFSGLMKTRPVVIGGTPWGQVLPERFDCDGWTSSSDQKTQSLFLDERTETEKDKGSPLVFWLAHHDLRMPGNEDLGRFKPVELPGVDVVINGHIHRRLDPVQAGQTLWLTPGNISRRARSDANRQHTPSALRINIDSDAWNYEYIEVPHLPFEEVFHEALVEQDENELGPSAFIAGLAELQARRTETGEGLTTFLDRNLEQFDDEVAKEIRTLAHEVTNG